MLSLCCGMLYCAVLCPCHRDYPPQQHSAVTAPSHYPPQQHTLSAVTVTVVLPPVLPVHSIIYVNHKPMQASWVCSQVKSNPSSHRQDCDAALNMPNSCKRHIYTTSCTSSKDHKTNVQLRSNIYGHFWVLTKFSSTLSQCSTG